jgi:hypothetical protein
MRRLSFLLPATLLAVASGCGAGAAVSDTDDEAAVWSPSPEPRLELGSVAGDEATLFSGVWSGTVLPDGRLAVGDRQSHTVRVFDAAGRHLLTFGGPGEGPTDLSEVSDVIQLGGDTLGVQTNRSGIKLFLATTGDYVRTIPGPIVAGVPGLSWFRALDAERFLLLGRPLPQPPEAGVTRPRTLYMTWSERTARVDTLGVFAGVEAFRQGLDDPLPTQPLPSAVARRTHYTAGGGRIYVGDNAGSTVLAFSFDGTPLHTVTLTRPALPVSDADVQTLRAGGRNSALYPTFERIGQGDALLARYEAMPLPATYPAFRDLHADRLGNLWVRNPAALDAVVARWDVFSRDGEWLADIFLPADLRILEIGAEYVLAVARDEFDVEYVRVYGIGR